MRIDFLFDTICPWCFIGKKQLDIMLGHHPNLKFRIYWHAFLIHPDVPAQGVNYHEYLQKRFSRKITLEHAHDVISRTAKTVDIEFDFNRINLIPNTIDSHRMVRLANRQNQAAEMLEAIYQHYFLLGCDIGDRSVLIHIGTKLGYNSKKIRNYLYSDKDILDVKKQNHHAQRLGINGVPAFVFDQQFSISGAHEPNILKKILDIAKDSLID